MEEYGPNVAFVYVSDDMKWGRRKLSKVPHSKNLFFIGCGDFDEVEYVEFDQRIKDQIWNCEAEQEVLLLSMINKETTARLFRQIKVVDKYG